MLRILKLKAENVVRYKEFEINFMKSRNFFFILGENGVGKSLIGDVLTDLLFDKTIRGSSSKSLIGEFRDDSYSFLSLEDSNTKEKFFIKKYKNHPIKGDRVLFIRKVGGRKENLSKKKKRDTYKVIWKALGINWETFKNRNFFGQGDRQRFLDVPDSKKAEIITNIQDLKDLQICKDKSREFKKGNQKKQEGIEKEIENVASQETALISARESLLEDFEKQKKKKKVLILEKKKRVEEVRKKLSYALNQTSDIDKVRAELSALKFQIDEIENFLVEFDEITAEVEEIRMKIETRQERIESSHLEMNATKEEILKIKKGAIKKCKYCGAKLVEKRTVSLLKHYSSVIKSLKEARKEIKKQLQVFASDREGKEEKLKEFKQRKENIAPILKKREKILRKLRKMEKWESLADALESELKYKSKDLAEERGKVGKSSSVELVAPLDRDIEKLGKKKKNKRSELNKKKKKVKKHEIAERVYELSIRDIFENFLKQLNYWGNSHLNFIKEDMQVVFNPTRETKSDKIVDEINVGVRVGERPFRDIRTFSRGERGRVNVSTQLALFSSAESPLSLLWLDEPFEGITHEGRSKILELLNGESEKGTMVIVITHQNVPLGLGTVFRVNAENGVSELSR